MIEKTGRRIQSESEAAHQFCAEYDDRVRFVPERGQWLIRDGDLWNFDEAKQIEALIREFLDRQTGTDPRWKGAWSVVRSVKGFAESAKTLHVAVTDIDAREHLVGTQSGVFDLRKGRFIKPGARTFVTRRLSVDPDFEAE